jgi:hypothetical protein
MCHKNNNPERSSLPSVALAKIGGVKLVEPLEGSLMGRINAYTVIEPFQGSLIGGGNTHTVTEPLWSFDRRAVEYRRNMAHNKIEPQRGSIY